MASKVPSFHSVMESPYNLICVKEFYETIKGVRELFTIVPVGEQSFDRALDLETRDFEDVLQYFSAEYAGADCIVTRNIKDYDFACTVETMEPRDFLSKYFPNERS